LFQATCGNFGSKATFGFDPHKIGNKSLRSGTALSLFLQSVSADTGLLGAQVLPCHSSYKIYQAILGCWALHAFLVYISPQVLEWKSNMMLLTMIHTDTFLDALNLRATIGPMKPVPPLHPSMALQ
jgi:hypothetical protein